MTAVRRSSSAAGMRTCASSHITGRPLPRLGSGLLPLEAGVETSVVEYRAHASSVIRSQPGEELVDSLRRLGLAQPVRNLLRGLRRTDPPQMGEHGTLKGDDGDADVFVDARLMIRV